MIVPRFAIVAQDLVNGCNQIAKFHCPRYCFTSSSSGKSPCGIGSLADSVFWDVSINTVRP